MSRYFRPYCITHNECGPMQWNWGEDQVRALVKYADLAAEFALALDVLEREHVTIETKVLGPEWCGDWVRWCGTHASCKLGVHDEYEGVKEVSR